MNRIYNLYFALFLIGLSSIVIQTVFLRELITAFNGNELIYGLVLAVWLVTYSAGAGLLGRLADRLKDDQNAFVMAQSLILILFPLLIYFVRTARNLLGITQGILISLPNIILISLLTLLPITVLLAFQFALGSKLIESGSRGIGRAYMLEATGAVAGGALLSFILLLFLNSFQIAFLLAIALAISALTLAKNKLLKILPAITAILLIFVSPQIDRISSQQAWRGFELIKSEDTPYGKLTVIKDQSEYSFFHDGSFLFSTASKANTEELVHLSLLAHKNPKNILLIGGGFGGTLNEMLKHRIHKIDYVELDPKIIELGKALIPGDLPAGVQTHITDGILFVSETKEKYDLLMVNLPAPQSALINRFYTREFFLRAKKILKDNGILVLMLPFSADYVGRESRALGASILKTASTEFKEINLIPGVVSSYLLAGKGKINLDPDILTRRWKERKIVTRYFNLPALNYDLLPERTEYMRETLRFDDKTKINSDLQPVSYYYALLLWSNYFAPSAKSLFYGLLDIKIEHVLAIILILAVAANLIFRRSKAVIIALLGFAGMTAQIIVILAFQARYGYVYQMIGLLTAAFMGGLALGSCLINQQYEKIENPLRTARKIISALALFLLLLLFIVQVKSIPWLLPLFSLLIGSTVGAVFPLVVKASKESGGRIGTLAGTLYGADLFGSSLAAILVSVFFIPIYGIINTGFIAFLSVLCAFVSSW